MKRTLVLFLALVMVMCCVGCGASNPATETEAVATEAAPETTAATQPPETVAETIPVLAEPADKPHKRPRYNFASWDLHGNDTDEQEVYDCRMYPAENGTTIFAVDYKTVAGLQMIIFGYADDGNDDPNYWKEIETLTTDGENTFIFEVENEVLDQIYHPGVFFRDQYGFDVGIIEIFHREEDVYATDGNPVGEAEQLLFFKDGKIKVHSASMQPLDNGYIRFTLECTPRKDLYYCFYSDPEAEGEQVIRFGGLTSGKKETIVADIWAEDIAGLHSFNFSFYKPNENPEARVYTYSATANFDELAAYNFFGFINGDKEFMLLYYGILDEAILGATLTAEDGSSVVVTEELLSKNGDGCSLVLFKEFNAKKKDTVSVTLSKEGCEDIVLELYVH